MRMRERSIGVWVGIGALCLTVTFAPRTAQAQECVVCLLADDYMQHPSGYWDWFETNTCNWGNNSDWWDQCTDQPQEWRFGIGGYYYYSPCEAFDPSESCHGTWDPDGEFAAAELGASGRVVARSTGDPTLEPSTRSLVWRACGGTLVDRTYGVASARKLNDISRAIVM